MGFIVSGKCTSFPDNYISEYHKLESLSIKRIGPTNYNNEASMYIIMNTLCTVEHSNISSSFSVASDGTLAFECVKKPVVSCTAFHNNSGPGMIVFYNSALFFKLTNFVFFDNDAGTTAKFISLITSESGCIKYCCFRNNIFKEFIYIDACKYTILQSCTFDFNYLEAINSSQVSITITS